MKKLSFYVIISLLWLVPGTMASPVQWSIADGGNGHYYEAVLVPEGISWTDADLIASSKAGDWHLATISSAEENDFVYDLVDDPAFWRIVGSHGLGPWIGGYKEAGQWKWVTGEPFFPDSSAYENWGPHEPFGNGDKIGLFGYYTLMGSYWNDAYDRHMPSGYVIESETILPPPVIEVSVDIKPGSWPNTINLGSNGVIPVAILTTESFDATSVDPSTVQLEGLGVAMRGKSEKLLANEEDVDEDGDIDLVVKIETENLESGAWQSGLIVLTGETYDGQAIEGCDEIIIVPPE